MLKTKTWIGVLTLALVWGLALGQTIEAASVRGYFRKDGTYVKPHTRSAPDGNPYNNYSFPGNYNPNTGKITGGNPDTYLDRYYNRQSGNTSSAPLRSNFFPMPGVAASPPTAAPEQTKTPAVSLHDSSTSAPNITPLQSLFSTTAPAVPAKKPSSSDNEALANLFN
jgi:hypothetical protein